MPGPFRLKDLVLIIAQDDAARAVRITGANLVAEATLNQKAETLKGADFLKFVPARIAEMISEYVEFEAGGNDVADVLRKVRDFQLKTPKGALDYRARLLRHNSSGVHEYMLILQNEEADAETQALMKMLREQMQGHMSQDEDTGLPDRETISKSLALLDLHRDNIPLGVCVAVLEMDNYEEIYKKYGSSGALELVKHVALLCQQNLRNEDVVMRFDSKRLALILIGTTADSAKMVLNRLRWLVAGQHAPQEESDLHTTLSILFTPLSDKTNLEELLPYFESKLVDKPKETINIVVQI